MEKVLLIDHHDSFTHNIVAWLSQELTVDIISVDDFNQLTSEDLNLLSKNKKYLGYILSPGPKSPHDYQHSLAFEKKFNGKIFGICLGFQIMLINAGYTLYPYNPPMHGKTSHISTDHQLFSEIKMPMEVARYHSLGFSGAEKHQHFLAFDNESTLPMIFYSSNKNRLGFQFHPESFLTKDSTTLAKIVSDWFKEN